MKSIQLGTYGDDTDIMIMLVTNVLLEKLSFGSSSQRSLLIFMYSSEKQQANKTANF